MSIVSLLWSFAACIWRAWDNNIDCGQRFEDAAKYHREKRLRAGTLAFVENWYYGYYALKQSDHIARYALKERCFAQWKALKVCNKVCQAFWPDETTQLPLGWQGWPGTQGPNYDGQI